ncbi:MAG: FG-GAP-like repeat-containing protein [Pseudomonadota bacterium]|nr:FG-GAP-like repeat-containing protein [Pseudomonadota bacterium]
MTKRPESGAPVHSQRATASSSQVSCSLSSSSSQASSASWQVSWLASSALDGDGAGDLLVGAIGESTQGASAGAVYLLAEPTIGGARLLTEARTTLFGEDEGDYAGSGVAFVGDVDGDGAADLLVGASSNAAFGAGGGRLYLLRGPIPTGDVLLSDAGTTISGIGVEGSPPPHGAPVQGDGVGVAFDGVGDFDGDGLEDLAVGANGSDRRGLDAGAFAIFLGPVADGSLTVDDADQLYLSDSDYQYAGDSVAAAGDLDGDGLADVLVGGNSEGPGTTWILAGPGVPGTSTLSDVPTSLEGEADFDYAGAFTARGGDLDGDGWADVIVGAYGSDTVAPDAGTVYLAFGPFGEGAHALADIARRWVGEQDGDSAGRAVAGGVDADGDGLDDVLIGAPYGDAGGDFGGQAYLVLSE